MKMIFKCLCLTCTLSLFLFQLQKGPGPVEGQRWHFSVTRGVNCWVNTKLPEWTKPAAVDAGNCLLLTLPAAIATTFKLHQWLLCKIVERVGISWSASDFLGVCCNYWSAVSCDIFFHRQTSSTKAVNGLWLFWRRISLASSSTINYGCYIREWGWDVFAWLRRELVQVGWYFAQSILGPEINVNLCRPCPSCSGQLIVPASVSWPSWQVKCIEALTGCLMKLNWVVFRSRFLLESWIIKLVTSFHLIRWYLPSTYQVPSHQHIHMPISLVRKQELYSSSAYLLKFVIHM